MTWTDPEWLTLAGGTVITVGGLFARAVAMGTRLKAVEAALSQDGNLVIVKDVRTRGHELANRVSVLELELRTMHERQSGTVEAMEAHERSDERRFEELRQDFRDVKEALNDMNSMLLQLVRRSTPPAAVSR